MIPEILRPAAAGNDNFFLIAGPCVVEGEEITMRIAREIKKICMELNIPFCFKASYRKANRSSLHSFTGIGSEFSEHSEYRTTLRPSNLDSICFK